jgi:hypothetical protein
MSSICEEFHRFGAPLAYYLTLPKRQALREHFPVGG